jgi:death-on-curing family protein
MPGEPLPLFNTRYAGRLESCLENVKFDYYPDLLTKAVNLFYLINTGHVFYNGNKRMAVVATMVFLLKNDKMLKMTSGAMGLYAVWVADSVKNRLPKDDIIELLIQQFKAALIDYPAD